MPRMAPTYSSAGPLVCSDYRQWVPRPRSHLQGGLVTGVDDQLGKGPCRAHRASGRYSRRGKLGLGPARLVANDQFLPLTVSPKTPVFPTFPYKMSQNGVPRAAGRRLST